MRHDQETNEREEGVLLITRPGQQSQLWSVLGKPGCMFSLGVGNYVNTIFGN